MLLMLIILSSQKKFEPCVWVAAKVMSNEGRSEGVHIPFSEGDEGHS
jgi:hypothetical protein